MLEQYSGRRLKSPSRSYGRPWWGAKPAGRIAKAKYAHDKVITAVYCAQADALEIESLAKRRLADEYDAGQARGEVRSRADNQHASSEREEAVGAADIGLTHKEIHEARAARDAKAADPGITRRALDEIVQRGEDQRRNRVGRADNL